jgi:hypothetical protein
MSSKGFEQVKDNFYTVRFAEDGVNRTYLAKTNQGLSVVAHVWRTPYGWEVDTDNADNVLSIETTAFKKLKQAVQCIETSLKELGFIKAKW